MTYDIEILSREEVEAMIAQANPRCPTGARNRALVALLYRAGPRCAESIALRPCDVSLEERCATIRRGKGHKRRVIYFDAGTALLIAAWLRHRDRLGVGEYAPLFCTLRGGPIQDSYIRHLLRRLAKKAGVERRVHPHGLRHTHAAELRREGVDPAIIRDQFGHSSLKTTLGYIDHLVARSEVADAISTREWDTRKLAA